MVRQNNNTNKTITYKLSQKQHTPCGIIMGYYGKIWSVDELIDYADFCKKNGYKYFIYGPKMDNNLRSEWSTPWSESEFNGLKAVRKAFKEAEVDFGMALSPSNITHLNEDLKQVLETRINGQINELNLDILSIGFDDFNVKTFKTVKSTIAKTQVETAHYIKGISNAKSFYVVPTYYSNNPLTVHDLGPIPYNYWETFGTLHSDIKIFWTGSAIIPNGFSPTAIK